MICYRNPRNGYMGQFVTAPKALQEEEECGQVCLSCYQDHLFEHGQQPSDFNEGRIRGGSFFDFEDLKAAGYVIDLQNVRISSTSAAEEFNLLAKSRIAQGYCVITNFSSLSILGDEGYVSLYTKPPASLEALGVDPIEEVNEAGKRTTLCELDGSASQQKRVKV